METKVRRNRGQDLSILDADPWRCRTSRPHLQPVSHRCRRTAALPHRAAAAVPCDFGRGSAHYRPRQIALDHLQPRRIRRMWRAQRMARGRAESDSRARPPRMQHLAQRYVGSSAARARRWRGTRSRRKESATPRHAAFATLLGCRTDLRRDHRHVVHQRHLHSRWRCAPAYRRRHSRSRARPRKGAAVHCCLARYDLDAAQAGSIDAAQVGLDARLFLFGDGRVPLEALATHYEDKLRAAIAK